MVLSTYSSYLTVNRDMKASLSKVESQAPVKRDTEYYEANIGKVKTVDDLLGDYRLYSYAMQAYGLGEMTYGKAFMRKVLDSDLSDSKSFANTLTDKRYLQMAQAFNFKGDAKVAQSTAQADSTTDAYKASFQTEETNIKTEAAYFASKIGAITNVDDLVNNTRLRTYVLDSAGLDTTFTSKAYLKQVLTSDLADPDSVANQAKNPAWKKLTGFFNFNADGTVNGQAQTADQTEDLKLDYVASMSTYPSATLLDANQRYWDKHVPQVQSAQDLVKDSRLVAYVKTAFGLNPTMLASSVASLMYSQNFAQTYGNTKLLDAFEFSSDGTLPAGTSAQTPAQMSAVAKQYTTEFRKDADKKIADAVTNYETRIAKMTKLDDFFVSNKKDDDKKNDEVSEVWDVALRAFGINPDEVSKSELKKILSSDVTDKKSYVNRLDDDRYVNLVKAFNFTADGGTEAPLTAQSQRMVAQVTADYKAVKLRALTGTAKENASKAADKEIAYYTSTIAGIKTADQFLADSRLTKFVLEANGLDPKEVTATDLRRMFKSDLSDPKSFVNTQSNGKFAEIVASFNFSAKGQLDATAAEGVQQRGAILETTNQYLQQTLEVQQGEQNDGVRLALYFKRKAPEITSPYSIISDKALFTFFKTAYNLPTAIGNIDVAKQADLVKKYIDVGKLGEPDYVDKIVKRFTALYDTQKNGPTSTSLSLLGRSASISADTLLAVAQLRAG